MHLSHRHLHYDTKILCIWRNKNAVQFIDNEAADKDKIPLCNRTIIQRFSIKIYGDLKEK